MRYYSAWYMANNACALDIIELFGRWCLSEFTGTYAVNIKPPAGLVAAAGFDATRPREYRIPRMEVEPPAALLDMVFAFAGDAYDKVQQRNKNPELTPAQKDFGAANFLELLMWMRKVRVQCRASAARAASDAPVPHQVVLASAAEMYPKYRSTLSIYKHAVFQHPEFEPYAAAVRPRERMRARAAAAPSHCIVPHRWQHTSPASTTRACSSRRSRRRRRRSCAWWAPR